jgi:hypothetical protein
LLAVAVRPSVWQQPFMCQTSMSLAVDTLVLSPQVRAGVNLAPGQTSLKPPSHFHLDSKELGSVMLPSSLVA